MCADPAQPTDPSRRTVYLPACVALLVIGALAHLWFLIDNCPLDLSADESHYWEWSRHLDLSYYSKGPLVAYIIALSHLVLGGISERLVGSEALAVRAPAVLLSTLTGLGIYVLALAVTRRARLALSAVTLTFTVPILALGSIIMTIDAPLACAWTWTLVCVERALRCDSMLMWALTGILIAAGILAKYTMLLIFPAVGLLILSEPSLRIYMKRPGPYLATAIGLLGLLPIAVWNARHDWVSLRHVAGQAGVAGLPSVDVLGVFGYIGGQLAVTGVVWFVGMIWALVALWRVPLAGEHERHSIAALRLLLYAAATPWVAFLLFSLITKVQPNWPMPALVPASVLLVVWLARRLRSSEPWRRRRARRFVVAGVVLGGGMVVVGHHTEWLTPTLDWLARGSPPLCLTRAPAPWNLTPLSKYDPTARLRGSRELGHAVGEVLEEERARGRDPFILADKYQLASLVAFYCPGEPAVYCAQSWIGGRLSQYDLWPNPVRDPERFLGRSCVYVGSLHPGLTGAARGRHAALPDLRRVRTVEYRLRGRLLHTRSIFVCDAFAGFDPKAASARQRF